MHVFHSYFPGKPALARCPIDFYSSLVANLCILSVEVSTFHILLDTVPPTLLLGSASGSSWLSDWSRILCYWFQSVLASSCVPRALVLIQVGLPLTQITLIVSSLPIIFSIFYLLMTARNAHCSVSTVAYLVTNMHLIVSNWTSTEFIWFGLCSTWLSYILQATHLSYDIVRNLRYIWIVNYRRNRVSAIDTLGNCFNCRF